MPVESRTVHWKSMEKKIIRRLIMNKEIKGGVWKGKKCQGICISLKPEMERFLHRVTENMGLTVPLCC